MANIDLDALLAAATNGDTITWNNADTLLAPASALGWLVNKEVKILGPHPRRNGLGAGGAKTTIAGGNSNGFRIAVANGNVTIENILLKGPGNQADTTGTGCGIYTEPLMRTTLSRSCTTLNSTSITNLSTTADLFVGCPISGTGIPASTVITVINSSTSITISNAATDATTQNRTFGFSPGSRQPHVDVRRCVIWGFGQDGISLDNVDEVVIDETDCNSNGRHGVYLKGCVIPLVREGFMASNGGSGIYLDGCVSARLHGDTFDGNGRLTGYSDNGQITNKGTSGGGYGNVIRDCEFENFAQYETHRAISVINASTIAQSSVIIDSAYMFCPANGGGIADDKKWENVVAVYVDASEYVLRPETLTLKQVGIPLVLANGAVNGGTGFGSRPSPGIPA